jgi:hypothetical protein
MANMYYWAGQEADLRLLRTKDEEGQARLYYKPPLQAGTPTVTVRLSRDEAHALNAHGFFYRFEDEEGTDAQAS